MTVGRTFGLMCWYAVFVYGWWLMGWHSDRAAILALTLDILAATFIGVYFRRRPTPGSR